MEDRRLKKYTKGLVFYLVAFLYGMIHLVVLLEIITLFFKDMLHTYKMEGARKRKLAICFRKWETGRVGGTSRGCLSTQLKLSFSK